jgi:hypothetical protein
LGIKWHVTIAIELKYQRSLPPTIDLAHYGILGRFVVRMKSQL